MKTLSKEEAKQQRIAIAAALNEGKSIRQIARELGCSQPTVIKVKKALNDPNSDIHSDRRESNGRPEEFTAETKEAILEMRKVTGHGPRMLWALIQRNPEKWGITDHRQIPSIGTIGDWLSEAKLTTKMVGARDSRGFPIDFEDKPGVIAMDEWGPRWVRGEKIFLVTAQDRFTKLSFGVPVWKKGSINTFKRAMDIAREHLLNGAAPTALWVDNGIGMALANGFSSQPVRHALQMGTRVVFNAPHHPWKNGRLENWHWRQDVEYWKDIDSNKTTMREAITGFLGFVNWYNVDRPHSGLKDGDGSRIQLKAPADLAPWYLPITHEDIAEPKAIDPTTGEITPAYPTLEPQSGIIDMVRMVHNNGRIDLQGNDSMFVSEIFGGQYLRIRFFLDPEAEKQVGQVIWQRGQKKEPIAVATFNHRIDRKRKQGENLVTDTIAADFSIDNYTITISHTPLLQKEPNWTNTSSRRQPPGLANASGRMALKRREFKARLFETLFDARKSLTFLISMTEANPEERQDIAADIQDEFDTARDMLLEALLSEGTFD